MARVVVLDVASVYLFYGALGRRVDSYTYDYYTALAGWTRHVFSGLAVTQDRNSGNGSGYGTMAGHGLAA